jgi:hypothetical protein
LYRFEFHACLLRSLGVFPDDMASKMRPKGIQCPPRNELSAPQGKFVRKACCTRSPMATG